MVLWTDHLPVVFQRLAALGVDEADPEEVRLGKAMLTLVASLLAAMACAWVAIYLAIGPVSYTHLTLPTILRV